jgi:hypothetical protein
MGLPVRAVKYLTPGLTRGSTSSSLTPEHEDVDGRIKSGQGDEGALEAHTGLPLACEELTVNSQPLGPATVNESWMRPRLISDGDKPFSA